MEDDEVGDPADQPVTLPLLQIPKPEGK